MHTETYESGCWAIALLPSSLPKMARDVGQRRLLCRRHRSVDFRNHCRLSERYLGHTNVLTGDKITVVAIYAVIGDASVEGGRNALVLSCMWPLEDRQNFSEPSRCGTLPPPYRLFNLAAARSSVRRWLVALLFLFFSSRTATVSGTWAREAYSPWPPSRCPLWGMVPCGRDCHRGAESG